MSTVDHQDTDDLHGLPDSHDFSKRKDFYAIYPSLYCSGQKDNKVYKADYCSPWGTQFDLHWYVNPHSTSSRPLTPPGSGASGA